MSAKEDICGSYLKSMETAGSSRVDVLPNTKAKVSQEHRAQVQSAVFRACSQLY